MLLVQFHKLLDVLLLENHSPHFLSQENRAMDSAICMPLNSAVHHALKRPTLIVTEFVILNWNSLKEMRQRLR